MACEVGEAVLSDIMVRKAWQRNCGLRQVRSWVMVLETASKAGGAVEVVRSCHPPSFLPLGDCVWEPCTWRYQNPWVLKSIYKMVQSLHITQGDTPTCFKSSPHSL